MKKILPFAILILSTAAFAQPGDDLIQNQEVISIRDSVASALNVSCFQLQEDTNYLSFQGRGARYKAKCINNKPTEVEVTIDLYDGVLVSYKVKSNLNH